MHVEMYKTEVDTCTFVIVENKCHSAFLFCPKPVDSKQIHVTQKATQSNDLGLAYTQYVHVHVHVSKGRSTLYL